MVETAVPKHVRMVVNFAGRKWLREVLIHVGTSITSSSGVPEHVRNSNAIAYGSKSVANMCVFVEISIKHAGAKHDMNKQYAANDRVFGRPSGSGKRWPGQVADPSVRVRVHGESSSGLE